MKITIIFDNEAWKDGLRSAWGFSCLVEAYGKRILFDTGSNGSLLLENMKKLDIEPTTIDTIFISHAHGDHTGGLSDLLNIHPIKVYIPYSFTKKYSRGEIVKVRDTLKIHENIFSTGELKGIEQSLVVKIEAGLVVIVGCSHPGVKTILEATYQFGKVVALIGGLHGFHDFDLIKNLDIICPTHCTRHKSKIKAIYPTKYIIGGAGKILEIK
jgi:7,8-dihydropterin-6-yl-methyl-4-(beta-D-ribofuranosyl)aminobenzene 5'-phosphate synthase